MEETILSDLFKTGERIRILRYVSTRQEVNATEIVQALSVSKALVSRYMHLLVEGGLCTKEGRIYRWIENPISLAMKRLLNIHHLMQVIPAGLPERVEGIGVYGSFAEGRNRPGSDLDLYLLVPEYAPDLEMMAARMEKAISEDVGVETHILILTSNRLSDLKETDTPFYRSLVRTGYTLKGESIEEY
ncbi:MAG: ArsR family transcriptional regulator [Methanocalculus sp. MSAO_Arc2]|uniref:Uncharacterized protein n=1 Tax=Methanocalculus chunghsingensis TaxID=156457 RepID=A0A8J7WBS7_9EURY|nr:MULTISPECIES: nucleotidyltransferase domain-containing protein [Methanocalculus]MBR1369802.1 hypothetical protein [Methanocalculus chunghsingensis]MCP1716345.1 putative nucleotidyltransferase [Methanocalculus alkaliphilus]RQD82158.1 MAG: ArsR family transcriptional regulator [Methanocalculus sp. MSAO_Arc2]